MTGILVGTASWTDRTLIKSGRFYPSEVQSAEARLRYHASQFCLVDKGDFTRRSHVSDANSDARRRGRSSGWNSPGQCR